MKIATFATSAQFEAIKAFVPQPKVGGRILDTGHEIDGKIFFARVVNGRPLCHQQRRRIRSHRI